MRWLELSPDEAAGMRTIFTVLGLPMLATTPPVLLIPDAARERRLAAARAAEPPTAEPTDPRPAPAAPAGARTMSRSEG